LVYDARKRRGEAALDRGQGLPAVAFVSPKGGAGKTTAALLLALGLAEHGHRVGMIDSDPNKPLVHWASLPGRPELITVHPAPTVQDVRDALSEARRHRPDWIILDTEGSIRGAMAFTALPLDLVLTPLAGSQLEALQAIKASEIVGEFGGRYGRNLLHRCLLTRVPAAIRPRSLKAVVEQLRGRNIQMLPTALIEKEAFRTLFAVGGGFAALEQSGVSGVPAARENAKLYLQSVLELLSSAPLRTA
jgi:chromosome partitioning protein